MKRTRTAMHMFYLLVIAILITLLYVERRDGIELVLPDTSDTNQPQDDLTERLEQQYQLLVRIDQRLTELESAPGQTEQQNHVQLTMDRASESTGNMPDPESQPTPPQNPEERLVRNAMQGFNPDLIGQRQRQTFEQEETDPEWAYQAEEAIRETFASDDYLRQLQYQSIECRTSLCRILINDDIVGGLNNPAIMYALNNIENLDTRVSVSVTQDEVMELYLQR